MTTEIQRHDNEIIESKDRWRQSFIGIGEPITYSYINESNEAEVVTAEYKGLGIAFGRLSIICGPINNSQGGVFWEDLEGIEIPGFSERNVTLEIKVKDELGWLYLDSDEEGVTAIKLGRRKLQTTRMALSELPVYYAPDGEV